jgi:hypothetical protein
VRIQEGDPAATGQQRPRMTAADGADHLEIIRNLQQQCGDEAFAGVMMEFGHLLQMPVDAAFQVGCEFSEGGVAMGDFSEGA